ncbi:MAG TPA: precorrin-2 C(20)-methyltransferase [Aurantimonas sp.]
MSAATGTLYGLGVGPGDPELLTLKALRLLKAAPVVAYPAPDHGTSFARAIVAEYLSAEQEEIPIVVPMRVERFPAAAIYEEAAERIGARLAEGRDVAVLCEGDPFFYGSFMYLFERLASRFPTEIVPGVSSVMAASAALKRPLAARNDVLTVIPGPLDDAALGARIEAAEAFAIMKLGRHFPRVKALIETLGLLDRCAYAERVSLPEERLLPLRDVSGDAPYFSMILGYRGTEPAIRGAAFDQEPAR